jgi:hypothetical protein
LSNYGSQGRLLTRAGRTGSKRRISNKDLACIIREAVKEWFWGGEITAKMLAAA